MARTVQDTALMLEVMAGYDEGLDPRQPRDLKVPEYTSLLTGKIENMKIGVLKEGFGLENSEEDVDKVVEEAAELLGSECGAVVEEVSIPMHSDGNCHGVPQIIVLKAEFDNMISPKNKWYLMQENVNEGSAC